MIDENEISPFDFEHKLSNYTIENFDNKKTLNIEIESIN